MKQRVKDGQSRDVVTREMKELRFEPSVTVHNSGIKKKNEENYCTQRQDISTK